MLCVGHASLCWWRWNKFQRIATVERTRDGASQEHREPFCLRTHRVSLAATAVWREDSSFSRLSSYRTGNWRTNQHIDDIVHIYHVYLGRVRRRRERERGRDRVQATRHSPTTFSIHRCFIISFYFCLFLRFPLLWQTRLKGRVSMKKGIKRVHVLWIRPINFWRFFSIAFVMAISCHTNTEHPKFSVNDDFSYLPLMSWMLGSLHFVFFSFSFIRRTDYKLNFGGSEFRGKFCQILLSRLHFQRTN